MGSKLDTKRQKNKVHSSEGVGKSRNSASKSEKNIRSIVNQLNEWAYQYYALDEPGVPDAQYD